MKIVVTSFSNFPRLKNNALTLHRLYQPRRTPLLFYRQVGLARNFPQRFRWDDVLPYGIVCCL